MDNFQVLEKEESQGSNEEEEQPKGAGGICNRTRPRSILKNLQSTTANETDDSESSTRTKFGHTIGPNESTEEQSNCACKHGTDAPLSKLLLQLTVKRK